MYSRGQSETVLVVQDLKRAEAFYRDVVRLAPEEGGPVEGWAWFWSGVPGEARRLALREGPLMLEGFSPRPEGQRWGPVHVAFEVPREKHRDAAEHVRSQGVEVYGPVRLEWMNADSYYFYDPDGNLIEWWSPDPSE